MKPAVSFCFSFLIYLLTCSANGAEESLCTKESLCARGLRVPIDKEPLPVAVWAANGNGLTVFGPGVSGRELTSSEGKWLNFTATQRDSEYCVSFEELSEVFCDKDQNWLDLWADNETKWNLKPASMASGCRQYYLLGLDLDLQDMPTKLLWRPGERITSLDLILRPSEVKKAVFPLFRKADSQLQYDMTFQRLSGDASCVVTSASLDVSRPCQGNQAGITGFNIESLDENGDRTPSYFSLNCEDGGGWQNGTTASSPVDKSTEDYSEDGTDSVSYISWFIEAIVGFVFVIALVAVAARRANTCQGDPVRPPASPPSPSPTGTLEPPPPRLLPQWNPFIHPDGQGSVQEYCENEEEEEYVDEVVALGALRVQSAREEEDAREQDTEPVQPAALLSHDSENSLYGIFDN